MPPSRWQQLLRMTHLTGPVGRLSQMSTAVNFKLSFPRYPPSKSERHSSGSENTSPPSAPTSMHSSLQPSLLHRSVQGADNSWTPSEAGNFFVEQPMSATDALREPKRRSKCLRHGGRGMRRHITLLAMSLSLAVLFGSCDTTETEQGPTAPPREGEPCNPGVDETCCVSFRPLRCSGVGETGVWYLGDSGCPCSSAASCGGGQAPLCEDLREN